MGNTFSRRSLICGATALVGTSMFKSTAAQGTPVAFGQNPVGSPLSIFNESGDEVARITVTEVQDPFLDWSDYGAPERGVRYILATVQIEAVGARPFEYSAWDFKLLDDIGMLYSSGWVSRSDASMVSHPDLEEAIMLPGETNSGSVAYSIAEVATAMQLVYSGYGESEEFLYLLANLTLP